MIKERKKIIREIKSSKLFKNVGKSEKAFSIGYYLGIREGYV
jgi:hypothetical protein